MNKHLLAGLGFSSFFLGWCEETWDLRGWRSGNSGTVRFFSLTYHEKGNKHWFVASVWFLLGNFPHKPRWSHGQGTELELRRSLVCSGFYRWVLGGFLGLERDYIFKKPQNYLTLQSFTIVAVVLKKLACFWKSRQLFWPPKWCLRSVENMGLPMIAEQIEINWC